MYKQIYLFYPKDQAEESVIYVKAEDLYNKEQGYGFITEQNMEQDGDLMLPELTGGFMPVPWYRMLEIPKVRQGKHGCMIPRQGNMSVNDGEEKRRQIPLRFKCKVPSDGSYRIKVTICPETEMSDVRIFMGRRCLAVYQDKLLAGEIYCQEMLMEVCGIIPRGQEQVYDEQCIELTVTADQPYLSEITIESVECPVLYIAGDSTVTDQSAEYPYAPTASYAGWGQIMPYFVQGKLPVSNHAHSGLTTESFREEGHGAIPMSRAKAGDFMLFQFGHNDQKLIHLKAQEGYLANLERYISECRDKGMYPLLVTPVARNTWRGDDGTYNDLLEEYAQACLELGERLNVPVLDLHRLSMEFILHLGKEGAKKYFYPSDYTHHNDFGAQRMTAMICQEIKRTCQNWESVKYAENSKGAENTESVEDLENAGNNAISMGKTGYRWLASQIGEIPDDFAAEKFVRWDEPACVGLLKRPEGFCQENEPEEFEEPDRPLDLLLRAEALDMVIRRAGFFITNVYNDFFTDIVGHEWYAGAVESGLQNGIVTEEMCGDGKFRPLEPVTRLDFITFLMMAYGSRKTLPEIQPCPYDGIVSDIAANSVGNSTKRILSAAYQLGMLALDGSDELSGCISRQEGAQMCRKLKIM